MKISIKRFVDRSHLLKSDIMNRLQVSKPTYYKLYNGTSTGIQLDTLEKICKLFKCSPNDVITGWENLYDDELPDDFITDLEVENNRDSFHIEASPKNNSNGLYAGMYTEEEIDKLFESPMFSKRLGQYIEGIMNATNRKGDVKKLD